MKDEHSLLPPSAADVWVHCTGHIVMSTMYPDDEETQDTREGEASHWVVESVLKSYQDQHTPILTASQLIGQQAPNGVIIDEDMVDAAWVCIDDVLAVCQEHGLLSDLHIEERLDLSRVHPQQYGTPDVWVFSHKLQRVYQWDYKYGHRDIPADSWQNKNYLAGILHQLNTDYDVPDTEIYVDMRIVQPRSFSPDGPVKAHVCRASDLRGDINYLSAKAHEALGSDPPVHSGNHCQYCPARHVCGAARKSAHAMADYAHAAVPEPLPDEAVSFELTMIERAEKALAHRKSAMQQEAISRIQAGRLIPGYGIQMGQGHRKFNASVAELQTLGMLIGVDMMKPAEPITPSEFDKRVASLNREKKEKDEPTIDRSVINGYIHRPETGLKLVPSDDTVAAKVFKRK